jgi:hypothetical protein
VASPNAARTLIRDRGTPMRPTAASRDMISKH